MKNLITTLIAAVALAVSATAFSQTTSTVTKSHVVERTTQSSKAPVVQKSVAYSVTTTNVNLLYLRDGYDNHTALSVPVYTFPSTGGRLTANTLGAANMNDLQHKVYVGAGLDYKVPIKNGYSFDLTGGLKGFDLANLGASPTAGFVTGKSAWVFGVGVTIPLR